MASSLPGKYRVAKVRHIGQNAGSTEYSFALFDEDIAEGDYVLCDTQYGYMAAVVKEILFQDEYSGSSVTREIICRLDFKAYETRKEARKKKSELKKKMDKLVKENQEAVLYQALADQNPEMAEMLKEYQSLI